MAQCAILVSTLLNSATPTRALTSRPSQRGRRFHSSVNVAQGLDRFLDQGRLGVSTTALLATKDLQFELSATAARRLHRRPSKGCNGLFLTVLAP